MDRKTEDYQRMICTLDNAITEAKRVLNDAQQAINEEYLFGKPENGKSKEGMPG